MILLNPFQPSQSSKLVLTRIRPPSQCTAFLDWEKGLAHYCTIPVKPTTAEPLPLEETLPLQKSISRENCKSPTQKP